MLDCARRLATQQVDGWIVVQPGDLGDALCDAGPVDVPLIAIAAPMRCQSAEVGADNRRAGFLVGSELGRTASLGPSCTKDSLVIVTNSVISTASEERADGIRSGIQAECPGLLPADLVLDARPADRAYNELVAALNALPDDTDILLAAVDDGVALGAAAAIPETRAARTAIAAIGADQRARCEIASNPQWLGDAALFPDRYGDVAVPALLDALHGREIPPKMFVETAFVTADSLGDLYDLSDCPDQ
jgi:ribose transport system substrate-binding protein